MNRLRQRDLGSQDAPAGVPLAEGSALGFAVVIAPVFDRHFFPVAAVTSIIASRTAAGAAFHASSLPAGAAVVTTRLAQEPCRLARTALAQGSHWLAPLRLVGVKMPRAGHTRRVWRRTLLIETDGVAGAAEQGGHTRMRAKPYCVRATFNDCGITALIALTLTADLRVSPSLGAAGFQEMESSLGARRCEQGRCAYRHQPG